MFGKKQKPLLQCNVLHSLPGRVRIGCRALRYLEQYTEEIADRIASGNIINSVSVNTITDNILIHYSLENSSIDQVVEFVESIIGDYALPAFKSERKEITRPTVNERRLQEEPISEMRNRVLVTTVSLLFIFLGKKSMKPAGGLLGKILNIPALTGLSLAGPIFRSGIESLKTDMRPNADTLSATAILSSILSGRAVSALTIIWLADIAELLTAYTMDRTRKAIRDMLSVGEEFVWRINEKGLEEKVPLEELKIGDLVIAHTGEKISVDGEVESGEASVDQASITGEFMPQLKEKGMEVFAGTVVKSGEIKIRADKVGDQTAIARIIHLVEEASHSKATIQAFADRFSAQFIPFNFALALIVYLVTKKSSRALNMLIIDYSCGARLSTATALSAAICNAARKGILIKGSNIIEMLNEADTLILDKTGTLTEGKPQVISIIPADSSISQRKVVELAAAAEETSNHPMAVAVLDKVRKSGWKIPKHGETSIKTAMGVETKVGRSLVRVGSKRFMDEKHIDLVNVDHELPRLVQTGENIIYVAQGQKLIGVLGIQDSLRENMKKALNRLRFIGIDDIILLTGDVEQHAELVANRMAMDRYQAEMMPDDKSEIVLRLQSRGTRVVMVGDGINDAPALAYADVGIAIGATRTDVAMEASDVTITHDDPLMVPSVFRLADQTMRIVRQNFGVTVGVNTTGLILASIGVLPVFWGAVLHNSCTVAVVLNSARLLFEDTEKGR